MGNEYDAIVVGSGLGGLTAGALFARAGHRVLVLERNESFGGAATTYHRGEMTIEASLHETTDPRTTVDPKGEIFAALDLYDDVELVPIDNFYEVRSALLGDPLVIPHGIDQLAARLVERFPAQEDAIRGFLARLEAVQTALGVLVEKHDGHWWLAHGAELPFRLWSAVRDVRSSVAEVLESAFGDDEALKIALAANLGYYSDDPDAMWWLMYAVAQGGFFRGGGNYVRGGSAVLSQRLVDCLRADGGTAVAGQEVVEIIIGDHGQAMGVRYRPVAPTRADYASADDVFAYAPVVFANAAPHAIRDMLPGGMRERFMEPYRGKPLSISLFSIALGLNRRPAELGVSSYSTHLIPDWMSQLADFSQCASLLGDEPRERLPVLSVVDYSHIDSGLGESELFPVNIVGIDRLGNWDGLSDDAYRARKAAWVDAIVARLDAEWPGFAAAVVERDMATARTMHERLNTPGGALYGFAPVVPERLARRQPTTAIEGLYLASAFGGAGGFTGAMGTGAAAAKAALRGLRRPA